MKNNSCHIHIRHTIDCMFFVLQTGSRPCFERLLADVAVARREWGAGWWSNTLDRIEAAAAQGINAKNCS